MVPWDNTGHNFRDKYIMRHEPLLCSMTWFTYKVVALYYFPLFSANINGSSLGWLKNTKVLCYIFKLEGIKITSTT